ncbi:MAG: hypothetical protein ACYC7E_09295 [Armatimonadota bacterium]
MVEQKSRTLHQRQKLIFSLMTIKPYFEADRFRQFAEMAAGFGATHLNVGILPYKYDWFLQYDDPYPSWANWSMGLFRVFTPPALQEWIPQASTQALQEVFAEKVAVLREFGLRGVCSNGVEPCFLPEGVYRAHPTWRGAQCELGRIAGKPYFTPSIDEPEVLDLYRWSTEQFARRFPEIDEFAFLTNDSAAGISWAANVYAGPNGPTKYRLRGPGERVAGWLQAMREGSVRGGGDAEFNVSSCGFVAAEREAIQSKLKPGCYLSGMGPEGRRWRTAGANLGANYWSQSWPAVGITDVSGFVDGLQGVYRQDGEPGGRAEISMDDYNLPTARLLLSTFLEKPGTDAVNRVETLLRAAGTLAGAADADALVRVWESVDVALHAVAQIRQRGFGDSLFAETNARWLIRPLVPQPLALTPDEKAHYERFLFSVGTEEQNADLCYILGKPVFRGDGVVWIARWAFQEAINRLKSAAGTLQGILDKAGDAANPELSLYTARLRVLTCILENMKLTIMYQNALNIADQPRFGASMHDYDENMYFDYRCLQMRKIAREELDNITELISLLQPRPADLIGMAEEPEGESVFQYGPDLLQSLQRKMDIMLDHWHEYETLYPTTKVWDLEPEAKEQLRD